jgi:hypothetical protein
VLKLLEENGIYPELQDERSFGCAIAVEFSGTLRKEQKEAVRAMQRHDIGVLCAPPAFGKTVVAEARRASADHLHAVRAGAAQRGQTGKRSGVAGCASAFAVRAADTAGIAHSVGLPDVGVRRGAQPQHCRRCVECVSRGAQGSCADRADGAFEAPREALREAVVNCFALHGRMSKRARADILSWLEALNEAAPRVLLATGRLIGEGFDHPPLDTLLLAMPVSWKGTLQQ